MSTQRVLAAVVFTDTVGFTKRTGENEEEAFALLSADFALMRQLAARYEGQVKKSTGDGLLMVFQSALQAVSCAVEMQRQLGEAAKTNPRALKHRIGIHLGDVMLSVDDVVGDGVNVANRLQGEAQPGAICMSQTVFDLVKTKMPIQPRPLGERHLRNVATPVHVYEIQPLFGPRVQRRPPSMHQSKPQRKSHAGIIAAIVFAGLCILGSAAILTLRGLGDHSGNSALPNPPKTAATPDTRSTAQKSPDSGPVPPATSAQAPVEDKPLETHQDLLALLPTKDSVRQSYDDAAKQYKVGYQFDAMSKWLESQDWAGEPAGKRLVQHWQDLKQFHEQVMAALAKTSQEQPLLAGQDTYYLVSSSTLAYSSKGEPPQQIELTDLKPDVLLTIADAVGIDKALIKAFRIEFEN